MNTSLSTLMLLKISNSRHFLDPKFLVKPYPVDSYLFNFHEEYQLGSCRELNPLQEYL